MATTAIKPNGQASSSQMSALCKGSLNATPIEVAKALSHLCALKRTTEFTDLQVDVWYGGLKCFPAWIINRAILRLSVSTDRFPEFGDVYQLCKVEASRHGLITEVYSPHGTSDGANVAANEIDTLGGALGLVVCRPK